MSRVIAAALLLSLTTSVAPALVVQAHAADVASSAKLGRPRLALVVSGAGRDEERLQKDALIRSLESSLGVEVATRGQTSDGNGLGVLSVMVSSAHTTLYWTLPDGRSGITRLRTEPAGGELHGQVTLAAQRMLARFGMGVAAQPAQRSAKVQRPSSST
jgi:hypothetical protein